MEAIVLAGGFGTRLRSVVSDVPKPLAPVAGKPFLHWLLSSLESNSFTRVVLSVGYLGSMIEEEFGLQFKKMELAYNYEEEPLGTGGAIVACLPKIKSDQFFVLNGDTFFDADFSLVKATFKGNPIVVGCKVDNAARYGSMKIENGVVTKFISAGTPAAATINGGIYFFDKKHFLEFEMPKSFSLEKEFLENWVTQRDLDAVELNALFIDIGVPEDYFRAQGLFG